MELENIPVKLRGIGTSRQFFGMNISLKSIHSDIQETFPFDSISFASSELICPIGAGILIAGVVDDGSISRSEFAVPKKGKVIQNEIL